MKPQKGRTHEHGVVEDAQGRAHCASIGGTTSITAAYRIRGLVLFGWVPPARRRLRDPDQHGSLPGQRIPDRYRQPHHRRPLAGQGLLGQLDDILKDYGKIGDELERLGKQVRNDPQKAVADFMMAAAKLNPCVRARRCSLVPYGKTDSLTGHGCCPGQTGHHLIPDSAVKDSGCTGYNYKEAPTVCAEGTGNSHGGSHQMLHDKLDTQMRHYQKETRRDSMSYEDYRNHAITTFYETFPESRCDRKCLKAQLDAHYKCSKDLKAVSGKGGGNSSGEF
ncbi:HNH/endonuclease VII fold toxin-2 domain-containing protein [Ralstonia solanacearum]|uniref:HNH/endonuclease VII fold toxin-2 domain-containing protein n=1 Tax=Ralstonia solanacearum TaxID=305 RepID=UPI00234BEF56|nr:HNH/endonuclease VII fold toxin-2 domain-containing protein [Ralstonia solanacearum]MDC6258437.1 HNH/endonuclease VII fold toxin-2 domain-containing protein [Ralstonia solanacearum]